MGSHQPDSGAVIVTGASRGLGAAAARHLAGLGAPVVLSGRSGEELEAVVQAVGRMGGRAISVPGDIRHPEVRRGLVQAALQTYGALQALANNAGVLGPLAQVAEAQAESWEAVWEINVLAPVLLTAEALPWLRQTAGRVVNVSSGAAERAVGGWGAYDISKAALNHFTRQLAVEEPTVTAVSLRPGRVDTQMQADIRRHGQDSMAPETYASFVRAFEQGELLSPELPGRALARLCLFAPVSMSGEFVAWDDSRLQSLAPD